MGEIFEDIKASNQRGRNYGLFHPGGLRSKEKKGGCID